ncbi:peptidoglycan-binding protein [Pseudomonadota bacterium]
MRNPQTLNRTLAPNASAHPFDVVTAKSALKALGHYQAPELGVSQFPDADLFQAIQDFQKAQGLTTDDEIKPDGETWTALQSQLHGAKGRTATQAAAISLQDMGRGNDEILAHLTEQEAKLLHHITDGGSINPETGLMEFAFGRIGGSKYQREKRAQERNRKDSATRAAEGRQRSGDWDSESGRTLGYNDFNPGGIHGDKERNGTAKTGAALKAHGNAMARQKAEAAKEAAKQRAKVKAEVEAQRRQELDAQKAVDDARRAAASSQKEKKEAFGLLEKKETPMPQAPNSDLTPSGPTPSGPASMPDEQTSPSTAKSGKPSTAANAAGAPRPSTGPQSTVKTLADYVHTNPGKTMAQQVRNIKRQNALKEKHAKALATIHEIQAKNRTYASAFVDIIRGTNNFRTINSTASPEDRRKAASQLAKKATTHKSITPERLVLEAKANAKSAQRLKTVALTHELAKRLDFEMSERAANNPKAQAAVARAMSYRQQNRLEKIATMGTIIELSAKHKEFGPGGLYGNLASGIFNKELTPTQMTNEELQDAIARNETTASIFDIYATLSPEKTGSAAAGFSAEIFKQSIKRMRDELELRKQEGSTPP